MLIQMETLVGVYIAVCGGMILFNCAFLLSKHLPRSGLAGEKKVRLLVREQLLELKKTGKISHKRQNRIAPMLRRLGCLAAFHEEVGPGLEAGDPVVKEYISRCVPLFTYLALEYQRKDSLRKAYFAYLVSRYRLVDSGSLDIIPKTMLIFVTDPSAYCRQNALLALYHAGRAGDVTHALLLLSEAEVFHDGKLVMDGLMEFTGDREELAASLWEAFPRLLPELQVAVMGFIRMVSGAYKEPFFALLADPEADMEVRLGAVRYFWKYPYPPAGELFRDYLLYREETSWEVRTIAATALQSYPGEETVYALKAGLHDLSWYVRNNAAQSLRKLGVEYSSLVDIYNGSDRYAREMLHAHMRGIGG